MQMYKELKNEPYLWDLFTRKEEYNSKQLDKYGRFLFKSSKNSDISFPYVSEYLLKKAQLNVEYPDQKKFAVVLTHDIDDIYITNQHIFRSFIPFPIHRDLFGFKSIISQKLRSKKTAYNNFKQIINLEEKYNAKSSFYFLSNNKDLFGYKYNLEDIQGDINFIIDKEYEIGLHTSYFAYDNLDEIKSEKEKLEKIINKKINGVRNHLLRFNVPNSWNILSSAGFLYDSSLSYHDIIGFRNGMCHPFRPFNLLNNKQIDIIEIPLCISDITLFSYMKKNASESWEIIKKLIDTTESLNGVLTILWHNWTFSYPVSYAGLFGREWTKLFEKIIKYSYKKNAWLTTAETISKWYFNGK